jgi:exosortase
LQGAVVVALGPLLVRALAFPLAYAVLLVPFGDEVVPLFQHITAQLCMPLLALAGIPATLNGLYITAPSGIFVVAEACSGVMFLVAMAAFAILAAHLCFRSWNRRIIFVVSALVTTIIANALRAFGTILIAESYGHDYAIGFDHLVYGWVFFAVTLIAVMLVARRWFDRPAGDPAIDISFVTAPLFPAFPSEDEGPVRAQREPTP